VNDVVPGFLRGTVFSLGIVLLAGCASAPPFSVTLGAMGASATFSTPGWTKEVPVTKSALVSAPVLMVPPGTANVTPHSVATVVAEPSPPPSRPDTKAVLARAAVAKETTIPVVEAPVSSPVLAIPK
jgi:hypothetical protein